MHYFFTLSEEEKTSAIAITIIYLFDGMFDGMKRVKK